MSLEKRKSSLVKWINQATDEMLLAKIEELQMNHEKDLNKVVGSRPNGVSITKREMIAKLNRAEKQIRAGIYITNDEMQKRIKSWIDGSDLDHRG